MKLKHLLFLLFCITSLHSLKAQQEAIINIDTQLTKSDIFVNVEQKPEFPGKKEGLIEFYKKTSLFSICDKKESNCKTLYYQIVVDTLGNVGSFKIIKGVNPKLDAETKRIVECMPKWKPGIQKGQPVKVLVTLDIKYKSE